MQTFGAEEPEITLTGKMWKRLRLNQRNKRVEAGGLENEMGEEVRGWCVCRGECACVWGVHRGLGE